MAKAKTQIKLVSKLSMKSIFGNPRTALPANDKETSGPLVRIVGTVGSVKSGESNFGEWLAFIGQFQAVNLKTNEVFRSGKMFLPTVAQDMLLGAVQSVDSSGVEFAFDIGIMRDDEAQVGYQYVVVPLLEVSEADPCARLLAQVGGAPQLEAPKEPEKTTGKKGK